MSAPAVVKFAFSLLFGVCLAFTARADSTVATDPVGFVTVSIASGKTQAISLPLHNTPASCALVSSLTFDASTNSSTISAAAANWTASFGPFSTNPFLLRFLTGANRGRHYKVSTNATTTITLSNSGDLSSVVAAGDRFEIVAVDTLGSIFGQDARSAGFVTDADPSLADNILIRVTNGWLTFYNDGNNWLRQGGGISNNMALLPESGMLVVRRGSTALTLTMLGSLPTTNLKSDLFANNTAFWSNRFPVDTTLLGLGLQNEPNWIKGTDSSAVDTVLIRVSLGWLTYFYDGTSWNRQGGSANQNPVIPAGTAVLIIRQPGTDIAHDQVLPYTL